jgi:L-ribulose-5-phosphate 3-epimerase UlaE
VRHPTEGTIIVFPPSHLFEKNKEALSTETGFGFIMMSLNDSLQELDITPWSSEQSLDTDNPHIERNSNVKSIYFNDRIYLF